MSSKLSVFRHRDNFLKYRYLLRELVKKSIKLQYRSSVLGMFWTFLQPLMTMIVLSIVFSNLFGKGSAQVVNYPVYLLSGRLLHDFFTQSTKRGMRAIRTNASIIKKVYVPKYIYPFFSSCACRSYTVFQHYEQKPGGYFLADNFCNNTDYCSVLYVTRCRNDSLHT